MRAIACRVSACGLPFPACVPTEPHTIAHPKPVGWSNRSWPAGGPGRFCRPAPNRPTNENACPDSVYKSLEEKYDAIVEDIEDCHQRGQPVLVGTISIEKSELLSRMLTQKGVEHQVLNAKYHDREAHIIAQAGRYKAVTIATNMAGRGTDIVLGGNAEYLAKNLVQEKLQGSKGAEMASSEKDDLTKKIRKLFQKFSNFYEKVKTIMQEHFSEISQSFQNKKMGKTKSWR